MKNLIKKLLWGHWESGMKEAIPYSEPVQKFSKRQVRQFNQSMKAIHAYQKTNY